MSEVDINDAVAEMQRIMRCVRPSETCESITMSSTRLRQVISHLIGSDVGVSLDDVKLFGIPVHTCWRVGDNFAVFKMKSKIGTLDAQDIRVFDFRKCHTDPTGSP